MRAPAIQTDWRTWLDASLFPLKIYVVAAGLCLLGWYASLNCDWPRQDCYVFLPPPAYWVAEDFFTFARFVAGGYILCALVLMAGGIIQAVIRSWRAATWSISFAGAALIMGWCFYTALIQMEHNGSLLTTH